MNKRELGLRIKSFRKEKGLSQKELASLMGYKDVSTIAKIETGVNDVTTEFYNAKAKRPKNSRLDKSKYINAGFKKMPSWQDALDRYLKEINAI